MSSLVPLHSMPVEPPLPVAQSPATPWQEARWAAFQSPLGRCAFDAVAGTEDVWMDDPYDEETIHEEARQTFSEVIDLAADRERGASSILLLQGDAGSGKTHLMGAFRRMVEERGAGFFTYAQMTTSSPDLWAYLLRNVVDCLQKRGASSRESAWLRLSDSLVERPCIPPEERETLRTSEDYYSAFDAIRRRLLGDLYHPDPDKRLHSDFLSALLALQRRDGNSSDAAMKYFRGNILGEEEARWLCCPQGLSGQGDAQQLFDWLLRAVRQFGSTHGGAFVLCIDQIEELFERSESQRRFSEMVATVCSLTDRHPGVVIVLACLRDLYIGLQSSLFPTHRDRVEGQWPHPAILRTERTADEICALVGKRLRMLDADAALKLVPAPGDDLLYPFTREALARLQGSRPRSVLIECHRAWEISRRTKNLPRIKCEPAFFPEVDPVAPPRISPVVPLPAAAMPLESAWSERWNDFRTAWSGAVPAQTSELAELLAWGVNTLAAQTGAPLRAEAAADLVHLNRDGEDATAAICNAASQGGKLLAQLHSLRRFATETGRKPLAVRATEFAKSPKAQVMLQVGELVKIGGRRVIFPEADWRSVQAWREFAGIHDGETGFAHWIKQARPLSKVSALRDLVKLDELSWGETRAEPIDLPEPAPDLTHPVATPAEAPFDPDSILLGKTEGLRCEPITLATASLTQHLAVLGGTGSGKTTVALTLIEGLLLRGIPTILIDRKGDLARYADPVSLAALPGQAGALFRERVDVALFTPGAEAGRPLALPVLPARIVGATSEEIRNQAGAAAHALAAMLGYNEGRAHQPRRAALAAAIEVLLELDGEPPTLDRLLDLMNAEDPALLQALDYIDPRNLRTLVQDLGAFRRLNARLLGSGAEPLEAERLLGVGAHRVEGKTRLCILSTKFLGGDNLVQFWVAQLLMELARFASAQPASRLQAVLMIDEADLFLPAVGQPASKQPIENALRRFRSQGIGLILASQNPGDFDYRCRGNIQTWLVGKITETLSHRKLAPVFGDAGGAFLQRLAQHATGEFCLVREDALCRFKSQLNLLRTEQLPDAEILKAAREKM
ncbi:MAG: putative ATPase [Chthoniobacteraceae bacterium]|nr:putative ATPase [Chthoniobacteraceae bacterium]